MKTGSTECRLVTALCVWGVVIFLGRGPAALGGAPEMARYEAVKALAARTLKDGVLQGEAVAGLLDALGDAACVVRFKAAEALAKTGPAAVPHLVRALTHSDRNVRVSSARALRAMGAEAKDAVPALERALSDPDYQVRLWVVDALGNIGPEARAALPAVRGRLRDRERSVRDAAAVALPKIDPEGGVAVPALAEATRDRADDVREAVCIELGKLGPKAATAMPALLRLLDDEEWQVRKAAAEALLHIDRDLKQSVAAVARAFAREPRPFMKEALFGALIAHEVGPEASSIVPFATERLKQKSADLQTATSDRQKRTLRRDRDRLVALLGRIGPAAGDAAPLLRELLADKATDAESRKLVEEALQKIGQ